MRWMFHNLSSFTVAFSTVANPSTMMAYASVYLSHMIPAELVAFVTSRSGVTKNFYYAAVLTAKHGWCIFQFPTMAMATSFMGQCVQRMYWVHIGDAKSMQEFLALHASKGLVDLMTFAQSVRGNSMPRYYSDLFAMLPDSASRMAFNKALKLGDTVGAEVKPTSPKVQAAAAAGIASMPSKTSK